MNRSRDAAGFGARRYGGAVWAPTIQSGAEPPHSKKLREERARKLSGVHDPSEYGKPNGGCQ